MTAKRLFVALASNLLLSGWVSLALFAQEPAAVDPTVPPAATSDSTSDPSPEPAPNAVVEESAPDSGDSSTPPTAAVATDPAPPIGQAPDPRPTGRPRFFEVTLPPSFEPGSIQETLEAEGFDVREYSKRADGTATWWVAPPSEADLERSERRVREAFGRATQVKVAGLNQDIDPRLAQVLLANPVKSWFFKFPSAETTRVGQQQEWQRLADAFAESKLDIRSGSTLTPEGEWYFYIDSSEADIPKIEELVRTVVKDAKFWRPPQMENYLAMRIATDRESSGVPASRRTTVVRNGAVGNTTHPFLVELPYQGVDGYESIEQTLESEGFDVLTFVLLPVPPTQTRMRIAPPSGADLKTSGRRLAEVLGPEAKIRDELSSVPPAVAVLGNLLTRRHWFFKWKSDDEADRTRVLNALADSEIPIPELTWSADPDGSWQISIDSSPLDVEQIEGVIRTLVAEPKIWRPIGLTRANESEAPPTDEDSDAPQEPGPSSAQPVVPPSPAAPANPQAPAAGVDATKFATKFLVLETDWGKANDRDLAQELASSLTSGPYELTRADSTILRRGHARVFSDDDAVQVAGKLSALGLVRSEFVGNPFVAEIDESKSIQVLGIVSFTFATEETGGGRKPQEWRFVVVASPFPVREPDGSVNPNLDPAISAALISIVGWRKNDDATTESSAERYVGSFVLRSTQSALVPLSLPGGQPGLTILVGHAVDRPLVRSLGPIGSRGESRPLSANARLDWDGLIRALDETDDSDSAMPADVGSDSEKVGSPAPKDDYSIAIRNASEDDLKKLGEALVSAEPSLEILGTNVMGSRGATIEARAAAGRASKLYELVKKTLPDAPVQIAVYPSDGSLLGSLAAANRETVHLSWTPGDESQVAHVEQALKFAKFDVGVISVQIQGNRISMQVEAEAGSEQAILGLIRETLPNVDIVFGGTTPSRQGPQAQVGDARYERYAESLLQLYDKDSDGALGKDEWWRVTGDPAAGDDDQDGTLTVEEIARYVAQTYGEGGSPSGVPSSANRETVEFSWNGGDEAQLAKIEEALRKSDLGLGVVSVQVQGNRVSMQVDAPAGSAQAILGLISAHVPNVPVAIQGTTPSRNGVSPPAAAEDDSEQRTLVVRMQYADASEAAKIVERLKADDRIVVVADARTNSLIVSAPPETKYVHVQTLLELLETLDAPVDSESEAAPAATPAHDRDANVAKLRADLDRVERQVREAAAAARNRSGSESDKRIQSLRDQVTQAFRLRLALQREEAAQLRERLETIEANLARRERVEGAVVDRRIEVLLDPALEWPDLSLDESPSAPAGASQPRIDSSALAAPSVESYLEAISGARRADPAGTPRRQLLGGATTLALEIARLTEQREELRRKGDPDENGLSIALIQRQLDLLREEFDARRQALQQELQAAKAKLTAAQSGFERIRTLRDTGSVSGEELERAEAEYRAAEAELARQEILLQQYDRALQRIQEESSSATTETPESSSARQTTAAAAAPALSSTLATPPTDVPAASPLQDDGSVPDELQGVWKVVRLAPDGKEFAAETSGAWGWSESEWRFYGLYAFYHYKDDGQDITNIYRVVADPSTTPKRMELHPIAFPFEDYAHIEDIKAMHFLYEVEGNRLRLAARKWAGHPELAYPAELAAAEGVDYFELERVGAPDAIVPVDEGAPAGNRANWTRSTQPGGMNIASWRRDDQFAIATSLALRLAELSRRIQTLEAQPEASRDPGEIDAAKSSFELLRQEFDARDNAARRELATAAESLAVAEARLQAAQKRYEARNPADDTPNNPRGPGADLSNAQVAAQEARDQAKSLEVLIAHYARARQTFPSSESTDAPEKATTTLAPSELLGRWRQTELVFPQGPKGQVAESEFVFEGDLLTVERKGREPIRYALQFQPQSPGTFKAYRFADTPLGRDLLEVAWSFRYEVAAEDEELRTIRVLNDADPPSEVAPGPGIMYQEFERVREVEPTVPPELMGKWRLEKYDVKSAPEAEVTATTWTFDETTLELNNPRRDRFAVKSSAEIPGTFETYLIEDRSTGTVSDEVAFYVRYEADNDNLKLAFGRQHGPPESAKPADGVVYYEFDRIARWPVENSGDEPAPSSDESADVPELKRRAEEIARQLRAQIAQLNSVQEAIGAGAALQDPEGAVEHHRQQIASTKASLNNLRYLAERSCEAADAAREAATDEDVRSELDDRFDRLSRSVLAIREIAEAEEVPLDDEPQLETRIERDLPEATYPAEELRREYEATTQKLAGLAAEAPERVRALARWDWLRRMAAIRLQDLRKFERSFDRYVQLAQDEVFASEKALADAAARREDPTKIDSAALYAVASEYQLERTRRTIEETKEEIQALSDLIAAIDAAETSESGTVPEDLQGRWRVTRQVILDGAPELQTQHKSWTFAGEGLTVDRVGLDAASYSTVFAPESPDLFRTYTVLAGPQGREIVGGEFACRYQIDGDRLRVLQGPGDGHTLPKSVAPEGGIPNGRGFVFYEFWREPVETPIPELQGRWRLTKSVVLGAPEPETPPNAWVIDGAEVTVEAPGKNDTLPVIVVPNSPDRFRAPGALGVGRGQLAAEFRFQREGDRLRVIGTRAVGPPLPETIAPAEGLVYAEFERVLPTPQKNADSPEDGSSDTGSPADGNGTSVPSAPGDSGS